MHISQLEKYMTEDFLNNAFELMGEESIVSIKVIKNMKISGLVNIQLAYANKKIYLLEVNPRASRTIPFVSKAIGSQNWNKAKLYGSESR